MDAIITAGGIPAPGEPLYEQTHGQPKALLDVAGKPMIQWVLDALDQAETIERIVVTGLDREADLHIQKPHSFLPNAPSMLENIFAGARRLLEIDPTPRKMLSVSSDIPTITGKIVDWMVTEARKTDHDVYYNVVRREAMEKRFPGSRRSYTRLKDLEVCGGDITMFHSRLVTHHSELWGRIIAARKNVFKQAALVGYGTLLLLLLRRLTLEGAVARAGKALGVNPAALVCPFPEIGMDVDKPFQLEIATADLAGR